MCLNWCDHTLFSPVKTWWVVIQTLSNSLPFPGSSFDEFCSFLHFVKMSFWQEQLKNFLLSYIFSSLVYLCKFFFRHITQAIHTILSFCDRILLSFVVFSDFYVFFTENGKSFSFVLEGLVFFVKAKKIEKYG